MNLGCIGYGIIIFLISAQNLYAEKRDSLSTLKLLSLFDSIAQIDPAQTLAIKSELNEKLSSPETPALIKLRVLTSLVRWFVEAGNCDSAMFYARKSNGLANIVAYQIYRMKLIGMAFHCKRDLDSALTYYYQAERLGFKIKDTFNLIRLYFNIGIILSELGSFSKATDYYLKSQILSKAFNDKEFEARSSFALASNMADIGQLNRAIPHMDRALQYFRNKQSKREIAFICSNLGLIYQQIKQSNRAYNYLQEALDINRQFGNRYEIARGNNNIALIYISQNKFKKALELLLEAEIIASELNELPMLPEIYQNLAYCYEQIGDFKQAYWYKEEEKDLKDSLHGIEMLKYTQQLQEEFEAEKRQLEITNLKQENDVKDLKNKARTRQRNVFIGLASGLLCVALLIFFMLRQRVRNARQVNEKNTLIHQQQMDEVIRKSELQSIHTMLETQEKERKRIAEDLHDRVGSMLSTVRLQFSKFTPTAAPQQSGQFEKVAHLLDETCEEIRQVSHNLVSGVLSTFGLLPALNDLAQALRESSQLQINIQSHGIDTRMESDTEIHIYRMLQELFNNTIRHAQATEVNIDLSRFVNQLTLMYSDNGRGFDTTTLQHAGIGLKNMYSRVEKLNGSLHIDSGKGNGSTFIFTIQLT